MISFKLVSETDVRRWMWYSLITLAAIQLYFVQEMVAALVMFSVAFAFVVTVALTLFILDRASQWMLAWAGKKCECIPSYWREKKIAEDSSCGTTRI